MPIPRSNIERLERRQLLTSLPPGFTETQVAQGLNSPTALAAAPDGRIFIAEQYGAIKVIKNSTLLATPFATVNEDSFFERGLLGIAIDPNFAVNHYVYVYYTTPTPALHNRISRFTANGDIASGPETVLVDFDPFGTVVNHMGGALNFGADGKLYVAVGDLAVSANSQSLTSTAGKILRFNADGTIPSDNPFYNQTTGLNRSIWLRGLRNPFTTAVQPGTGRFYVNDVGQDNWEEIDEAVAGANYGWPSTEGDFTQSQFPMFTRPTHVYSHNDGCSIIGGAFYNPANATFPSQYVGKYFFGDFCGGFIKTLDPVTKAVGNFATGLQLTTGIILAPDGALWHVARGVDGNPGLGKVFKIQYTLTEPPSVVIQPASQSALVGETARFFVGVAGTSPLSYQWQRNNVDIPGATGQEYTTSILSLSDHSAQFRCRISNSFGNATSNAATLSVLDETRPVPTIVSPAAGTTFGHGELFSYSGSATDVEDGILTGSAFTWQVDYHTGGVPRPFVPPTSGSKTGSFTIPVSTPYLDTDVFYRITLKVTDSLGFSSTVTRDLQPRIANLTLATNIPGSSIFLDGAFKAAPHVVTGVEGADRSIEAPLTQYIGTTTYEFVGWSDGGAAMHTISFPGSNSTRTANYRISPLVYLSDLTPTSATNGWGPVEKDKSNGEQGTSDGGPINLNQVIFAKGLGVHASSQIIYNLAGAYGRFQAKVGIDEETGVSGSVVFQVFADAVKVFDSGVVNASSATQTIDVSVAGANQLRLVVTDGGNGTSFDHGDWADAKLVSTVPQTTIAGTSGNDTIHIQTANAGAQLRAWINTPLNNPPTQTINLGNAAELFVNSLGGGDVITLNFGNGLPVNGTHFNIDAAAGSDTLILIGMSSADSIGVTTAELNIATISIDYTGTESLLIQSGNGNDVISIESAVGASFNFNGGAGSDQLIFNAGTHTISSDLGIATPTLSVQATGLANVTFAASQHLASLALTGASRVTLPADGSKLIRTTALSLLGSSVLDLNDNDLIVDYDGVSPRAAVQSWINAARAAGSWTGAGIASGTAAAANPKITTLGLLESLDYKSMNGSGATFNGEVIDDTTLLVKFTYYGDADFNGIVDFDDYVRADNGFNSGRSGWSNGDFDGSGLIDFDDYVLLDSAFNGQTMAL